MPEGEIEVAYCHACGNSMDVTMVAPFSNVECPACKKHTRVKREFGPYTLIRRHAIGGMSVVFIAQDNTLGREVVVKILNEEYGSDEKRISAFEEEARITASFSHPHVVRVFTTGRAFDRFYIAMELVPGGHFEHHIRERGSIPEKEMLPLAIQVAAGLKAAHAAGLIHRDVKPGNILLDASGNAKIVDFGLALVTKGGKAQAAEIWATPYYVPPETIEGLAEDFRSDVYAFGATLYHALAGKPSCNEESMDTNRLREAKKKIPSLARAAPWVSRGTCAVVDRAMAHNPLHRYRSYDDLLGALESARQRLANAPAASPGPARVPAVKVARRSPAGAGETLGLVGATLLVIAALVFGVWWVMQPDEVKVAKGTEAPAGSAPAVAATLPNARTGPAYREAGEALRSGDYDKARILFAEVRDLPGVLEPTGSWAACEAVVCSYLGGKAGDARGDAAAASRHIQGASGLDAAIRPVLLETLGNIADFKGIAPPADAATPSGPHLLAALISGLKNWEHGMPDAARPHFDALLAAAAEGPDRWIEPYRDIVRGYLADEEKLAAVEPKLAPETAEKCREMIDELNSLQVGLQTKGRALFNLRAMQLELEKRAARLEKSPATDSPAAPGEDILTTARKRAAACRFAEAGALIKSPVFAEESGGELASAIFLLTEAAAAFLGDLAESLATPPPGLELELRDKSGTGTITGSWSGGLKARDAAGSSRDIQWADLSPDSLIELHRQLVKDELGESERLRRHEQAIAFDLLAGDPERAKEAAGVLSARSPAFKRRWDMVQPALMPISAPLPAKPPASAGLDLSNWPVRDSEPALAWKKGGGTRGFTGSLANAARWTLAPQGDAVIGPDGSLLAKGGGFVIAGDMEALSAVFKKAGSLTLEVVFTAADIEQGGPARLVTFSESPLSRNLTLGQEKDALVLRLRTPATGENGSSPETTLCKIEAGRPYHCLVSYEDGTLACFLNGEQVYRETDHVTGDFTNWTAQHLLVGDERASPRPWRGRVEGFALYGKATDARAAALRYRGLARP